MEFNKENLINNFEYLERSGVMVFFNPSTFQRSTVQTAVAKSPSLDELLPETLILVSDNGHNVAGLIKVPNHVKVIRSFGGDLKLLFEQIATELKGVGLLKST